MIAQPEQERWATCAWCRRTVPLGDAIDEGWVPDWWDGDTCHSAAAWPNVRKAPVYTDRVPAPFH